MFFMVDRFFRMRKLLIVKLWFIKDFMFISVESFLNKSYREIFISRLWELVLKYKI